MWDLPESLLHFAWCSRVHASLLEYRWALSLVAEQQGLPLVRHMWLHYAADTATYAITEQFLLGPELLACPALRPSSSSVRCYLPAHSGSWTMVWDSCETDAADGKCVTCASPPGEPCVFVRSAAWAAAVKPQSELSAFRALVSTRRDPI